MKKALKNQAIIIIAVLVVVSSILISSAETVPTFTASNAKGTAGEEVTVDIECSGVTAITCWGIKVTYDQNVLEFVKSDLNGVFTGTTDGDPNNMPYVISWVNGLTNESKNGKIAEITFKIKDSAAEGEYPITLEYDEKEVVKINDSDKSKLDQVHFDIKNGKVEVTENTESSKPESSKPESSKPESSKTESSKPESSKPESSKPESSKPESSKPESSTPESSTPESSKPESNKPESSKPASKAESNTSSTKTISSTSSKTETVSANSNNTSSRSGVTSPKTGAATPFVGTITVMLISAVVIFGLGKRRED